MLILKTWISFDFLTFCDWLPEPCHFNQTAEPELSVQTPDQTNTLRVLT